MSNLDRTAHFDKLGVNDVLLQIADHLGSQSPGGARNSSLPLLDRIAKNESFLHISRERAAAMAEAIRTNPAADKTQPEKAQR